MVHYRMLVHCSQREPLTGLLNRDAFVGRVQEAVQLNARHAMGFCLGLMDIDGFKSINDRLGHLAGDDVLRRVADFLSGTIRASDVVSQNRRLRSKLAADLGAIGIPSDNSSANFILARFKDEAEANAADAHLKSQGIIVRKVPGYGFPDALRITVGLEEDCARVVAALTEFKGAAQ